MKVAETVRNIDRNGRVLFPTELRKAFNMKYGDPVEIADKELILIRKYNPTCIFCCEKNDIRDIKDTIYALNARSAFEILNLYKNG